MADKDRFRVPLDGDLIDTLASDTRREVLQLLKDRRMTLSELARELDLQKSTVLEHLRRLDDEGLVDRDEADDRIWVYYDLTPRGRSMLNPKRSQLYLVLGGAAAAALVAVVLFIVAQGMMTGPAAPTAPDVTFEVGGEAVGGESAMESSADGASADTIPPTSAARTVDATGSDVTWWRGIDGPLTVRLGASASSGTLAVVAENGSGPALTVAVADHRARLQPSALDALDNATYRLRYRPDAAARWTTLDAELTVASARVHVLPARLVEDTPSAIRVAATPSEAIDRARIRIDGSYVAPDGRLGGTWLFNVEPERPGAVSVRVGRRAPRAVPVVPYLATEMQVDGNRTEVHVQGPDGGPLQEVAVHVDGRAVGFTNASGRLAFARPADGPHRVNLSTGSGRSVGWTVAVHDDGLSRVQALAVATRPVRYGPEESVFDVVVTNDAPSPRSVGVVARAGDRIAAARRLDVPASGHATAALPVPADPGPVDVRVRVAAKPPLRLEGEVVGPVVARSRFDTSNPVQVDDVAVRPRVDDRLRVEIEVSNPAPVPASRRLPIAVDGTTRRSVIVDLGPGASTTEIVYLDGVERAESVTVAGRRADLTGTAEDGASDRPAVPGPGIVAVLTALAVAALRLRRR